MYQSKRIMWTNKTLNSYCDLILLQATKAGHKVQHRPRYTVSFAAQVK